MELRLCLPDNNQRDMPAHIICCVCKRSRAISQYSGTQLTKLRRAIDRNQNFNIEKQRIARCVPCTASVSVELNCHLCGHIRDIEQFSRNQRIREDPICQPCMNFQLSLDAGGNPIDENDGYGKADNDFARLEGPPQKTKPDDMQENDEPGSESAIARTRRGETGSVIDTSWIEIGKSGFARVKAHRAPRSPVEEPTPAPGWTTKDSARKVEFGPKECGPWTGHQYI